MLKLKPRPLQNSFCRLPLLKNSDTNRRTSARVCRLPTTTGCSLFIPPLQHRPPPLGQVRCSNAYQCGGALKSTGIPFCAICDELKLLKSSEDPRRKRIPERAGDAPVGAEHWNWSSSHERHSLKPSTVELGLEPRPTVRAFPQRLGKSLKSFRAERWGCDTAASSCQPDQPDECRTGLSRTHVSDLPRRAIAALPCGVPQSLLYEHLACQT